MGNRTARHLNPGQHDLRGKKTKTICRCCDEMVNYRAKILTKIAEREMQQAYIDADIPALQTDNGS